MAGEGLVKVRYLGAKRQKMVSFPVPFLSLSEGRGSVTFNGHGDVQLVPAGDAVVLCRDFAESFERVDDEKPAMKAAKTGERVA